MYWLDKGNNAVVFFKLYCMLLFNSFVLYVAHDRVQEMTAHYLVIMDNPQWKTLVLETVYINLSDKDMTKFARVR